LPWSDKIYNGLFKLVWPKQQEQLANTPTKKAYCLKENVSTCFIFFLGREGQRAREPQADSTLGMEPYW